MSEPNTNRTNILKLVMILLCISAAGLAGIRLITSGGDTRIQSNLVLAADKTSNEDSDGFQRASGPVALQFPDDYGPHPDFQTEWWYYTGNLASPDGRHFGYQLTFFRRALLPEELRPARSSDWAVEQVYMAHFALTDTESNKHYSYEKLSRGAAGIAGAQSEPYRVWLHDWRIEQTNASTYSLVAAEDDIHISLVLDDLKGPVLHGVNGYSQKGPEPGNASYYYSLTRLETKGTITLSGELINVAGLSWKDHEYSTSALSEGQVGWDWFSIQLSDHSELMVFQIRQEDGSIDQFSSGTLIGADGQLMHLEKSDFEIEVTDSWKSAETGAVYPSGWILRVPQQEIELELTPRIPDQEMRVSYAYWEGAVSIKGRAKNQPVTGNGYVELSGYAGSLAGEF